MDFFINTGIIGISLIILGKSLLKTDKNIQEYTNFEILNKFICYMESELVAKINLQYGKILLISGILGSFLYNTLGLLMAFVSVLAFTLYIIKLLTGLYKFYINA